MKDTLDEMTNDQLAYRVAEKRGCRPFVGNDGKFFCQCGGRPHGKHSENGLSPLFVFPRDIAIGFLRFVPEKKENQKHNNEGFTFWRVFQNEKGLVMIENQFPVHLRSLEFALMLKGALVTGLQDVSLIVKSYMSEPKIKSQNDELGEIIGDEDGFGPEGS